VVDVLVEDGFEIYHIGYIRSHSVRLKFQVLEDVGGIKEVEEVERLLRRQEEVREKLKREYKVLLYGRMDGKLVALVLEKFGVDYFLMCVDVNEFLVDLKTMLGDP
jgi:molybdopterin converting factor small subunit